MEKFKVSRYQVPERVIPIEDFNICAKVLSAKGYACYTIAKILKSEIIDILCIKGLAEYDQTLKLKEKVN